MFAAQLLPFHNGETNSSHVREVSLAQLPQFYLGVLPLA